MGKLLRSGALASALAILALGRPAAAMDWPLSPPRLAATFGTFAKGRLIAGIALSAEDGLVHAAEDGELSFAMDENGHRGSLPSPLGSFVVMEHQRGMAAVYSHLAPGSLASATRAAKKGDVLGKAGSSGWIEGSGMLFQVFDRRAASWVNPLLVLPPLADDKPPVIRSLALTRGDRVFVLGEAQSLPQGTYKVSVEVADPADSSWTAAPLAPYVIRLSIDGVEEEKDIFDVIRGVDGELRLFALSPIPAGELRTKEGRYALGDRLFTRGRASLEVRVEDAAGNRRSASWTVGVE
jgi:hypothetical protein